MYWLIHQCFSLQAYYCHHEGEHLSLGLASALDGALYHY